MLRLQPAQNVGELRRHEVAWSDVQSPLQSTVLDGAKLRLHYSVGEAPGAAGVGVRRCIWSILKNSSRQHTMERTASGRRRHRSSSANRSDCQSDIRSWRQCVHGHHRRPLLVATPFTAAVRCSLAAVTSRVCRRLVRTTQICDGRCRRLLFTSLQCSKVRQRPHILPRLFPAKAHRQQLQHAHRAQTQHCVMPSATLPVLVFCIRWKVT